MCIGKYRNSKQPAIWVMTISDDYKSVTMWDPDQHHQTQLDCRIQDEKSLKNYLNPYHESPLQKEDAALYKQLKEWQKWEEPKIYRKTTTKNPSRSQTLAQSQSQIKSAQNRMIQVSHPNLISTM